MLGVLLWLSHNPFSFLVSLGISTLNWGGSTEISNGDQNASNSSQYSKTTVRRLGANKWSQEGEPLCTHEACSSSMSMFANCCAHNWMFQVAGCNSCSTAGCNNINSTQPRLPHTSKLVPVRGDGCDYQCCQGDPGGSWSEDDEFVQTNLIRFYFTAAVTVLATLYAISVFQTVKKQPPFPDAALIPHDLKIDMTSSFTFKFCAWYQDPSICIYIWCCDCVGAAENHATVGTANFWYLFGWFVFANAVGHVVAAVFEIMIQNNLDIENYVRGLALALVMAKKRQALRGRLGQGDTRNNALFGDFVAWFCCFCCAGIQEYRQVQAIMERNAAVVGASVQVQSQNMMPPTVVGAPAGGEPVVGQPVTKVHPIDNQIDVVGTPVR